MQFNVYSSSWKQCGLVCFDFSEQKRAVAPLFHQFFTLFFRPQPVTTLFFFFSVSSGFSIQVFSLAPLLCVCLLLSVCVCVCVCVWCGHLLFLSGQAVGMLIVVVTLTVGCVCVCV